MYGVPARGGTNRFNVEVTNIKGVFKCHCLHGTFKRFFISLMLTFQISRKVF